MSGQLNGLKVWWIVGASTGIGRALVNELDRPGNVIYISSRKQEDLVAIASSAKDAQVIPLVLDVSDEIQVLNACKEIESISGYLQGVIINAGTCEYLNSWQIDVAMARRVMETNFFGALNVVSGSLPLIRQALDRKLRNPKMVFISSSVTYQALPRAGAYGGSKAALRYFAESLKIDLQHEGIDVRVVSPGFVKTPLTDKNDFPMPFIISAEDAARSIMKGLKGSRFDIDFPRRFTWSLKFTALLPERFRTFLLGKSSRHLEERPS